ncbi:MAG TPA: hypothetical protein VFE55_20860 [Acidimicrobiia bacterium]|nr:hypothetical protein [Acidimicrobiia bacterium]
MKLKIKQRAEDERGTILVITLAFLTLAGLTVVGLLNYSTTALTATNQLAAQRSKDYDADGAMDAAIAKLRTSTTQGYVGSCSSYSFPSTDSLTANNSSVALRVDCTPTFVPAGQFYRDVLLSVCPASVTTNPCPDSSSLVRAHVKIYDDQSIGRAVSVDTWSTEP